MRFSRSSYLKREIVQSGKLLRETLPEASDEVLQAFRVAHDWRAAHAYPMHRIRHELRGKIRRDGGSGLTAGRVKRMASIRRKLSSSPVSLYQMQDLAGIRAILPKILTVRNRVVGWRNRLYTVVTVTERDVGVTIRHERRKDTVLNRPAKAEIVAIPACTPPARQRVIFSTWWRRPEALQYSFGGLHDGL
jgi:hypothetical protein